MCQCYSDLLTLSDPWIELWKGRRHPKLLKYVYIPEFLSQVELCEECEKLRCWQKAQPEEQHIHILTIFAFVERRQTLCGLQRQLLHLMGHCFALGARQQQAQYPAVALCSEWPLRGLWLHPALGQRVKLGPRRALGVLTVPLVKSHCCLYGCKKQDQ